MSARTNYLFSIVKRLFLLTTTLYRDDALVENLIQILKHISMSFFAFYDEGFLQRLGRGVGIRYQLVF